MKGVRVRPDTHVFHRMWIVDALKCHLHFGTQFYYFLEAVELSFFYKSPLVATIYKNTYVRGRMNRKGHVWIGEDGERRMDRKRRMGRKRQIDRNGRVWTRKDKDGQGRTEKDGYGQGMTGMDRE